MAPLAHIRTYVYNKSAQVWSNRVSVSTALEVGPILSDLGMAEWRQHIHASVGRIPREEKNG